MHPLTRSVTAACLFLAAIMPAMAAVTGERTEKNGLSCAQIIHRVDDKEQTSNTIKLNKTLKIDFKNIQGLTVIDGKIFPALKISITDGTGQEITSTDNALAELSRNGIPQIFGETITATVRTGGSMAEGETYALQLRLSDTKGSGEIEYQTTLEIAGLNRVEPVGGPGEVASLGLSLERSALANNNKENLFNAFSVGDAVQIFLLNIRGLEKGSDGLYSFDMDMTVSDASGSEISSRTGILGEKGHTDLPDGILESPLVTIPTKTLAPGTYTAMVRVYDRNSPKSLTVTRSFALFDMKK
ncbi:MAG: hypothetical protein GX606_06455 [Elusimicrobia bacterium]|nr:hypothetical protein [Elusimicrobiota bacterium]